MYTSQRWAGSSQNENKFGTKDEIKYCISVLFFLLVVAHNALSPNIVELSFFVGQAAVFLNKYQFRRKTKVGC